MGTAEKLRALEELWDDLLKQPDAIPTPGWHGDVLAEREAGVRQGEARFDDWRSVRKRLRDRFNYAIYYDLVDDLIRVYAVLDCRRSPAALGTRLGSESSGE
ncbi:addiction module protein [Halorhodospira sp. 9622]|nr:addiction module protein [Halorhodospira sp. 9622]MCG5539544.1 addiction module protein [Halorhodospira sp. 9622]